MPETELKPHHHHKPTIVLIGGGAAGLWTSMALLSDGWRGDQLTIVEPSGKTEDDRTWSYWAKESLFPPEVKQQVFSKIILASNGKQQSYDLGAHRYYSVRSSQFYAYAKEVLAKAGVRWINAKATNISDKTDSVEVLLSDNSQLVADYILDSRPPEIVVPSERFNATLQHFGGWFVKMSAPVFDEEEVVFMDFIEVGEGVAFFYVIPSSNIESLVEIAVFSENVWEHAQYDDKIKHYIVEKYGAPPAEIKEREYGVIPMTDQPLWRGSTRRVWNIGTRGGWVQPSSGYAFTRTFRFAKEVASNLSRGNPSPWAPSSIQQVFNAVMLSYIIDNPEKAGSIFYNLFANNGPSRTFDFLDEDSSIGQTIRLMWTCPQLPFAGRAIKETVLRIMGTK
jgi:lycopene beta-cyclase